MTDRLFTAEEMAEKLRVPLSWIYSKTRQKGADSIPVVRVGKYCRFFEDHVFAWLQKKEIHDSE